MGHINGTQNKKQEMATNYLAKRGNTYFFRRRVPDSLWEVLGKKEIKKALGTSDLKVAKRLAAIETVRCDELFEDRKRLEQQVAPATRLKIGYNEALLRVAAWVREMEEGWHDWAEENFDIFQRGNDFQDAMDDSLAAEQAYSGRGKSYAPENGKAFLKTLLGESRCEFGGSEEEFSRLAGAIRRARLEDARRTRSFLERKDTEKPVPLRPHPLKNSADEYQELPAPRKSPKLGALLDQFMSELQQRGRTPATVRTYTVPVRFLREMLGEKTPVSEITRDKMKELRSLLASLPANAAKFYPNVPLSKAIEMGKKDGRAPVEAGTVVNYLTGIHAFFNYAVRIEALNRSPISDDLFRQAKKPRTKKAQFKPEQLAALFESEHFTKNRKSKPGRFWVPLLALFHGTRSNETCQLHTADIFEEDGIWAMKVEGSLDDAEEFSKRLKTNSSLRTIPIHPRLIELGFLDFVLARKRDAENPVLFVDLKKGANGYYSDPFQKWFGRLVKRTIGNQTRLSMHSFRHGWKDAMTNAGTPEIIARQLGGWSSDGSAFNSYGQGASMIVLQGHLKKIDFGDFRYVLDLSPKAPD